MPLAIRAFRRKLQEEMPNIKKTRRGTVGSQTRVWIGAEIIDEELKPKETVSSEPDEPRQSQVDRQGNRKLEVFDADHYFPGSKP